MFDLLSHFEGEATDDSPPSSLGGIWYPYFPVPLASHLRLFSGSQDTSKLTRILLCDWMDLHLGMFLAQSSHHNLSKMCLQGVKYRVS